MTSLAPPTLSGAERGRVRPVRIIEGGIYLFDADGNLKNVPCALRVLKQNEISLCFAYARQYLSARGDGQFSPRELSDAEATVRFHLSLVSPDATAGRPEPLYPLPANLTDSKGKIDAVQFAQLALWGLADGQLERLAEEYALLLRTQLPTALNHDQWTAIVNEGKSSSLKTLHSQHGSSALIQVLHGLDGRAWPE